MPIRLIKWWRRRSAIRAWNVSYAAIAVDFSIRAIAGVSIVPFAIENPGVISICTPHLRLLEVEPFRIEWWLDAQRRARAILEAYA